MRVVVPPLLVVVLWLLPGVGVGFVSERPFGVEWELKLPLSALPNTSLRGVADTLESRGLPCVAANHHNPHRNAHDGEQWKVHYETASGLIMTTPLDHLPCELVTPKLRGQTGLDTLARGWEAVRTLSPVIDESVEMHVHVSAEGVTFPQTQQILSCFVAFERVFDSISAWHTREDRNLYAKSNLRSLSPNYDVAAALAALNRARTNSRLIVVANPVRCHSSKWTVPLLRRWHKLNVHTLRYPPTMKRTFEFRQHQGTTDVQEMSNWVRLVLAFVENALSERKAKDLCRPNATFDGFFDLFIEDPTLKEYYRRVRRELANPNRRHLSVNRNAIPPPVACDPYLHWAPPGLGDELRRWRTPGFPHTFRDYNFGCEEIDWQLSTTYPPARLMPPLGQRSRQC